MSVGLKAIDAEPIGANVVRTLEEALEAARDGKVSSVAVALVYRDGSSGRCWSEACSLSALIGSVTRLQAALVRLADD